MWPDMLARWYGGRAVIIHSRRGDVSSGLYMCVLVGGCIGCNHSCLTWKRDWLGGICIGIWTAKRYRHIRKGGWGN